MYTDAHHLSYEQRDSRYFAAPESHSNVPLCNPQGSLAILRSPLRSDPASHAR